MAQTSFPFDAGAGASVLEGQWQKMARRWLASGVIDGYLNALAVSADGTTLGVTVATGGAFVEGFFYDNDAPLAVALAAANATNPRIDRIVVRLDRTANTAVIAVVQGTPAASPGLPAVSTTDTRYELVIAHVTVPAAAGVIVSGNVSDQRYLTKNAPTRQPSLVGLVCTPTATAAVAVVARGLAGQVGNIFEVQNDVLAALVTVNPSGNLGVTGGIVAQGGQNQNASGPVVVAQGSSQQTGSLFEARSGGGSGYPAAGTPLSALDSFGRLVVRPGAGSIGLPVETAAFFEPRATSGFGAVLRGLAAQSGDMLQVQNSSGSVIAYFSALGRLGLTTSAGGFREVEVGAADSAGAGYRTLRVLN